MEAAKSFSVRGDGFAGALYAPSRDAFAGKALIVFGGTDGIFSVTRAVARRFCAAGLTTLALAYWNAPGLPSSFREVPVDTLEKAAAALKAAGYGKVGLWGFSKGGELALLAGSLMPELVSCVVAVSPINAVCQGFSKLLPRVLPCSSWSWHGKGVPFSPYAKVKSVFTLAADWLRAGEATNLRLYRPIADNPAPESVIPAEKIGGPLLLISSEGDSAWPAGKACRSIMARLREKGFGYTRLHLSYKNASHLLLPVRFPGVKLVRAERRFAAECRAAREDAFRRTLDFLKKW